MTERIQHRCRRGSKPGARCCTNDLLFQAQMQADRQSATETAATLRTAQGLATDVSSREESGDTLSTWDSCGAPRVTPQFVDNLI
ncbi:hypothetical protein NDU88_011246 [Pleurodeles waltl]|uniref:Uncharacterized protein n=1 Tax=Pleurodeles waltl TaxID=8319 RepID=A0AAV7S353_PLEWA|nr:hypothetical protein NDU88_011246 [Pleurodeles waltl]